MKGLYKSLFERHKLVDTPKEPVDKPYDITNEISERPTGGKYTETLRKIKDYAIEFLKPTRRKRIIYGSLLGAAYFLPTQPNIGYFKVPTSEEAVPSGVENFAVVLSPLFYLYSHIRGKGVIEYTKYEGKTKPSSAEIDSKILKEFNSNKVFNFVWLYLLACGIDKTIDGAIGLYKLIRGKKEKS